MAEETHPRPTYNPDTYWAHAEHSYPYYPTARHRRRFIVNTLARSPLPQPFTVFDFGCGEGTLLQAVQQEFDLPDDHIGGCDISAFAVESARAKLLSPHLHHALFPPLPNAFDVMICSEVLEHTTRYREILIWMRDNLRPKGLLILTTQAGRRHTSDHYTGHTQHFAIRPLTALLTELGFTIEHARLWGFPFFTLQKYFTNLRFDQIRRNYLEGPISGKRRIVFTIAHLLYFLHDGIPLGPQIYITARKT